MKKNKELWIINHYATPPGYGGLTRHYYLAKYLQKLGYKAFLADNIEILNAKIYGVGKESKKYFKTEKTYTYMVHNTKELSQFKTTTYTMKTGSKPLFVILT